MTTPPSKAQLRALTELAKGSVSFGPGFVMMYRTGKALCAKGLATALEDKPTACSCSPSRRRYYMRAIITPAGLAALRVAKR